MDEVGGQVASPIFMQQVLSGGCYGSASTMSRKRDLPYQNRNFQSFTNPADNWNPNLWNWDSVSFVANPTLTTVKECDEKNVALEVEDESLRLNLGGGLTSTTFAEESVARPNKRVRSGSPGNSSYPMCQVDNCKEDLSNAKDYHRRHKVCELHSKSTQALVAKQMQRFCQQCSRFHLLSEFDEGKRSCRRRLAGHNRRRRKTQPEDVTSQLILPGDRDNKGNGRLDIFNLLAAIARAQGKNEDKHMNSPSLPDREQLLQIVSKINSLPLPGDLAAKLSNLGSLSRKISGQASLGHQDELNGRTSASATDLLAVLSATLASSAPDVLAILSQRSGQSSDSEKTMVNSPEQVTGPNLQKQPPREFPSAGGERSSTTYQSPMEVSDCHVQEMRLPLQLFSSSPETESPPKLSSSRKYFSSDSSNPIEERSPSSSPVVQTLFPIQTMAETIKSEKVTASKEVTINFDLNKIEGSEMPLDLFRGSNRGGDAGSAQSFPYQAGYASSGSDHSPSSLNSDAQDRTGRIIFKLFDKDPSHFPGTLRTQIYNWLSNSPSEMESYIRPGCVVMSVYLSMPSTAWDQLQHNLLEHTSGLVQSPGFDFWSSGRFMVHTGRQLVSHKDGKVRLCKSWRTCNSPELISVSPLAVVGGQETSLTLRGKYLTNIGTKIHCTYMGGYTSNEATGPICRGTSYEEVHLDHFRIDDASPGVLGRCFIEVENGFKGNSFPLIIADVSICKELRVLESMFSGEQKVHDIVSEDQNCDDGQQPNSKEEALHFLNELGWLFQRKRVSSRIDPDYSLSRFKFLLAFSVERNCSALVKILLNMLVEQSSDANGLSRESIGMLSDIHLLFRAVKKKCSKMVDVLIHYSIVGSNDISKSYIFLPNLAGPGGITPLHLAACMSGSDDVVDALTNDPQEIGLKSWSSLLDANGQSPHAYALITNNQSYNNLVARKLVDRRNGQVTLMIENATKAGVKRSQISCTKCAVAAAKYSKRFPASQGLLQRPFIHSMLGIAAVCVCVCLFLRGSPDIGSVAPFKWENLDFGTI